MSSSNFAFTTFWVLTKRAILADCFAFSCSWPLNNDHLFTTATILGYQGWSFYKGLTVLPKFQFRLNHSTFPQKIQNFEVFKHSAICHICEWRVGWTNVDLKAQFHFSEKLSTLVAFSSFNVSKNVQMLISMLWL